MPRLESDRLKSKLVVQNLKIVVDNSGRADDEEDDPIDDPMDDDEEDSEEKSQEETAFHVKLGNTKKKASKTNKDENISDVSDEEDVIDLNQEIDEEVAEEEDDDTEFHVNLDKVPPSLQNTTLNEKIYINETLRIDPSVPEDLNVISDEDLQSLYASLDLTEASFMPSGESTQEESDPNVLLANNLFRKEALHLFGVDELSTNELFAYFGDFKPFAVEWINDSSCNVVWRNEVHAANALLSMSQPFDDDEDSASFLKRAESVRDRKPPIGIKWRKAVTPIKHFQIYMRFVRRSDRKIKGAESKSRYYQKYGNPNYGNIRGLISDSKRKQMKIQQLNDAVSDLFEDEKNTTVDNERTGTERKLVSYELDEYKECLRAHDTSIEEFGTGASVSSSAPSIKLNRDDDHFNSNRQNLKRKKMRMYSDEITGFEVPEVDEEKLKKRKNRFEPYLSSAKTSTDSFVKSRLSDSRRQDYQRDRERFERRGHSDGRSSASTHDPNDLRNKLKRTYPN